MLRRLLVLAVLLMATATAVAKGVYLTADAFIASAFDNKKAVSMQALWLHGEAKKQAEQILNRPPGLRMRYWVSEKRTAWIFNEIGKELPITIGVVIAAGQVADVRILAFRESRGWEVRYPYFTQQFTGLTLVNHASLSGPVDGISGATLSVNAVTRAVKAALYFHSMVP